MITTVALSPALHGQLGIADELLLFCLPVVIAIVILAVTSQRARRKQERSRTRSETDESMNVHAPDSEVQ